MVLGHSLHCFPTVESRRLCVQKETEGLLFRDRGDRGRVMRHGNTTKLRERLHALAAFLTEFEKPGFEFGQWMTPLVGEPGVVTMPYFTQDPVAESLYLTCYDMGWVLQGFDWQAWTNTTEAAQLRDNPGVLERATPEQLGPVNTN